VLNPVGLHTQDLTGQSHYIPNPLKQTRRNDLFPASSHQLAPGPLLFSSSTNAAAASPGFSRWSPQNQDERGSNPLNDVEMTSPSSTPLRSTRTHAHTQASSSDIQDIEMSGPDTPHRGGPSSSSNVQLGAADDDDEDADQRPPPTTSTTRPISLNGVKKELKRRLLGGGPIPQPTSDSRGGSRAIVLRAEGTNDGGLGSGDPTSNFNSGSSSTSNSDDDDQDDNQDDDKSHPHPPTTTSTSLGNPSANPRRRTKAGPRQINQYTLNMYNNHPHTIGSGPAGSAGSSSSLSGLGGPTGGMGLSSGLGGGEGSALGMGMGMGMGVGVGTGGPRGKGWVDADLPYIFIG